MRKTIATLALLGALLVHSGVHAEDGAPQAFLDLNKTARSAYADAKAKLLAETSPYVIANGSNLVFFRNGERQAVDYLPPLYSRLKEISHLAFGTVSTLLAAPADAPLPPDVVADLTDLRQRGAAVLDELPAAHLPEDLLPAQRELLQRSLAFLDRVLSAKRFATEERTAFARGVGPLLLANAARAAKAQVDGLDAVFRPWYRALGDEERARLYVLVPGPKMPRPGNVVFTYFTFLMGEEEAGKRIIYTEGVFAEDAVRGILGTIVIDREVAEAFFNERMRMDRDLLADGAEARLLEMFGRLGSTAPAAKP